VAARAWLADARRCASAARSLAVGAGGLTAARAWPAATAACGLDRAGWPRPGPVPFATGPGALIAGGGIFAGAHGGEEGGRSAAGTVAGGPP
jgi:hypothetical protein